MNTDILKNFRKDFPDNVDVACCGIEGANAMSACLKIFPHGKINYVDSFKAVFEAVDSGRCAYGVLPIENSFNGSVRAVYELVIKYKFFIVKSILLPIRHDLLAKRGAKIETLENIYSHSQALGQCSKFLNILFEKYAAKTIPFWNTAGAAKMVAESENLNIAAIASPSCAKIYGLECLAADIQDNNNNYTKFICISKEPAIYEKADHISLIIGLKNIPGALSSVLSKIASHGVNMNKIESCPKADSAFEYIFFIEIEASVENKEIISMLEAVEENCTDFVFLGNYVLQ